MSSSYYSSTTNSDDEQINQFVPDYKPFIADIPISSYGEPFPIPIPDTRDDNEINLEKFRLRKYLKRRTFDVPIKLSDFCLIAQNRWDNEVSDYSEDSLSGEIKSKWCFLL